MILGICAVIATISIWVIAAKISRGTEALEAIAGRLQRIAEQQDSEAAATKHNDD